MLSLSSPHPSLDALHTLHTLQRANENANTDVEVTSAIGVHVASCDVCQQSLVSLKAMSTASSRLEGPVASAALKSRMLSSVASDFAPIATNDTCATKVSTRRGRWMTMAAAAAALVAVTVVSLLTSTPSVEAGGTAGTMHLSTTTPRNGDRVTVQFVPGASLGRFKVLRLRARIRTAHAPSYAAGIPVTTLAELTRARDGSFNASFTLPDSIVFAAIAVEDTSASEIDDNGGRTWEVSRADAAGKVTFAALEQRAHDLMGRNWEEITSTAERMVRDFPNDLRAWSWLRTSQTWRGVPDDSIRAFHRAREAAFDKSLRADASLSSEAIGEMYWYARGLDSAGGAYWESRLRRDAPNNSFAIQLRLFEALDKLRKAGDTTTAIRTFDELWQSAPAARRDQVSSYAMAIANGTRDAAQIRIWSDRLLAQPATIPQPGLIRRVATDFTSVPALHDEGLNRLRAELARLSSPAQQHRALDETREEYRARLDRSTRATLTALGRALVRDGKHRAALDTLALAAAVGWNVDVFRAVREASLSAGDSSTAVTMSARLAVDPRTSPERRELLAKFGIDRIGAAAWSAAQRAQQREFVDRTLSATRTRTIAKPVNLVGLDGAAQELRAMTKGQVTIVAFWSRFCGPAIEVIPRLHQLATRLGEEGIRTITILEETQSSPELAAFLTQHDFTLPVLLDAKKEASQAFNQWGTPYFYVLDPQGRIVFEPTSDIDELLVNAEAVRLAGTVR